MIEAEQEPRIKFRGTSIEVDFNWLERLTFDDGEALSYKRVRSTLLCY
jgi:hypothetical protein